MSSDVTRSQSVGERGILSDAVFAGRRGRVRREALTAYLFLLPAIAITFIFGLWPVFPAFYVSLHKWNIKPRGSQCLPCWLSSRRWLRGGQPAAVFAAGGLPLSKAPIMTLIIFAFIGSWNSLLWPLIATKAGSSWWPVSVGLQNFVTEAGTQTHLWMAGASISMIPVLILYFLAQKQSSKAAPLPASRGRVEYPLRSAW